MASEWKPSPLGWLEGFIFAPEDARRLAALRIGLFGLLALRLAIDDFAFVADQPAELFDPVSLFHLLPEMPSSGVVHVLQPLGIAAALLAAAGLLPRITFPTALAIAVFLQLMLNATGKIVHNDVLLVLCLIPLVAVPRTASRAWTFPGSLRRDPAPSGGPAQGVADGWPVRTAMVIVGLAYLIAGLQKLRYSGIDWFATDNLRYVLWAASDSHAEPNTLGLFIADHDWLAHLFAAGTIVLEVSFILCVPFAKLRWIMVPSVVALHVGIRLMMGLDYSAQWLTVVIVFVNWVWIADAVARRSSQAEAVRVSARPR